LRPLRPLAGSSATPIERLVQKLAHAFPIKDLIYQGVVDMKIEWQIGSSTPLKDQAGFQDDVLPAVVHRYILLAYISFILLQMKSVGDRDGFF
jgi:hypothetical protein